MNLANLLPKEAVLAAFIARDKKQALKLLSTKAAEICGLSEREIYSVLTEREHRGSTCMGAGVCIPHGRFETLEKPYALFARLKKPVDCDTPDARPVDLIFLLLTPAGANTEHIKALALVSKLLRNKAVCENVRQAPNAEVIYTLLELASQEDAA